MSTTTTAAATALGTWTIDPAHSHVEFAVRHMMITTVKGRFGVVHGGVRIDDADPSKGEAEIEIDADSIDTREAQRDAHLKSADFFDVEKFPKLTFKSSRISDVKGDNFKLHGDLTIHGVTRPVTLAVTSEGRGKDPWGGDRAGFRDDRHCSAIRCRKQGNAGEAAGGGAHHGQLRRGQLRGVRPARPALWQRQQLCGC